MTASLDSRPGRSRRMASSLAYLGLCLVWVGTVRISVAGNTGLSTDKIQLSAAQLHVVDVVVALPGLLIWLSILFAALSIGHYARTIKGSKEAPGFRFVSYGIFALLASLVVASYLGNLRGIVSQHAHDPEKVRTAFVIAANYVSVISGFVTYGLVLKGARLLLHAIGKQLALAEKLLPLALTFVVIAAAYVWLIHSNPVRQTSGLSSVDPTFGLPYWITVFTVALPLVASWFVGVLALMGIYQYHQKTGGVVYKLLFRKLFIGISLFIGLTILLQLLVQLGSLYTDSSLSFILGLIAVVYLILAYGFLLMAQGARRLNTIEIVTIE